jgi:hypothetical protein
MTKAASGDCRLAALEFLSASIVSSGTVLIGQFAATILAFDLLELERNQEGKGLDRIWPTQYFAA